MPQRFKTLSEGLSYEDYQRTKAWIIRRALQLVTEHGWANCQRIQEELIPVLPTDTRPTINAIHLILYNNGRISHSEAETYRPPAGQLSLMGQQAGDFDLEPEAPPVILEPMDDPPAPEAPPIVSPKAAPPAPEPELTTEEAVTRDRQVRDARQRYTELKHRYDVALDDQTYFKRIYDMFEAEIHAIPPAPKSLEIPPIDPDHHPQDAVAFISCLHLGEVISEAATHGLGRYDVAMAQARFQDYIDSVINLAIRHHKGVHFDKLWLVDVGDNISGTIHDELARTNELYTTQHVVGAARLLACGLRDLSRFFDEVEFIGLPGNHPRMWPKPVHKEKADNFDTIVYHMVSVMVRDIPNVRVEVPESFFRIVEIKGHRFLFLHGDTISMWNQIPYYGINRARVNLSDLLRRINLDFEYFCVGNFHTTADMQTPNGAIVMTGSSKGPDEYSITKLATGAAPMWLFFGVHPRWGKTFTYPVNLSDADPKTHARYLHDVEGAAGTWEWPDPAPDPTE
jgi:hypothetical protein